MTPDELRKYADWSDGNPDMQDWFGAGLRDVANEIERLRGELQTIRGCYKRARNELAEVRAK